MLMINRDKLIIKEKRSQQAFCIEKPIQWPQIKVTESLCPSLIESN